MLHEFAKSIAGLQVQHTSKGLVVVIIYLYRLLVNVMYDVRLRVCSVLILFTFAAVSSVYYLFIGFVDC